MTTTTRMDRSSVLAVTIPPDPRRVPAIRAAARRWAHRHGLEEKRRVIELLATELTVRGIIRATSDLLVTIRCEEGVVCIEVGGEMTPEPQRLSSIAELAGRRGEAILAALARDHGSVRERGIETLWCEVWARPSGLS